MTLRRRTPLKPSVGTRWPTDVREQARARDRGCLGPRVGMPEACLGEVQLDHVRASGGVSMKSRSTLDNAAHLCVRHHDMKTREGRRWRPVLLEWIDRQARLASAEHTHVELAFGCPVCNSIRARLA